MAASSSPPQQPGRTQVNQNPVDDKDADPQGIHPVGKWIPLVLAWITALVSALVLTGWVLEIDVLKSVLPGWVSMKPNTAIGLFLASVVLALLSLRKTRFGTPTIRILAALLAGLGALVLGQYIFGFDADIDEALFRDSTSPLQTSHPGRMAPTTAFCFLVLGAAFFTISQTVSFRVRLPLVMALGGAIALIGLFSVAGYATDTLMDSRWWAYSGMAVHTAIGFVLLGSGLICLGRNEAGFKWHLDRPTTIGFFAGIVLMLLAAQLAFSQTGNLLKTREFVTHHRRIIEEIRKIASLSATLESSQLGYLITGDERLLAERAPTHAYARKSLDRLQQLTSDNPQQQKNIQELERLLAERDAWEEHTIVSRRQDGIPAAMERVAADQGTALRTRVNQLLHKMENEGLALLALDKVSAETAATTAFLLLPLGVFLSLAILMGGMFFLNAGLGERDLAEWKRRTAFQKHADEIARLNRLYEALSQVNQAIVRAPDREALFAEVCRVLVEYGGFCAAWIGWHDPETSRLVPVAQWGNEDQSLADLADDRPQGQRPSSVAFRENRVTVCNDFLKNPSTLSWQVQAARNGLRGSAVFPIRLRDEVGGTLTVYSGEPDYFQRDETALLKDVADDISLAANSFVLREENRQAEMRVLQEHHFSNSMIESMPGIVYFYDEQMNSLRWNQNFSDVSGYTVEEIKQMRPLDFIADEEKALLQGRITEVFEKGESCVEASFVTKDGRAIPYFFTGRRIVFDGAPCLVGMGIDMSERRRAEENLRRSEQRYRSTLDAMMEGCQLIGFDWRYLYLNVAAAKHARRPAEEMLGRTLPDVWPGIENTTVFAILKRCMEERVAQHEETEFVYPDGSIGFFDVRCQPIAEGIFVLSVDATERKKAQSDLRALNATLERRVASRTVELQALNRELESFCYSVSHDLRAPLRGIAGFTQILEETCGPNLDETSRNYLSRVIAATAHMGNLIDDLLNLSRVTRDEFHRENVDLSALARSIVEELRQQDPARTVEVSIAGGLQTQGDQRLLRIAMENLIGNAWKFTSKKSAARIEFASESHGKDRAFFIRDNGAGFDMRYAEKLFAPFQRLHRVREFDGTGIGLATVQRVISRHGGRVWAEAKVDQGATFWFVIEPTETP